MPKHTADNIRYSWQLLRAGPLKLDGGSMFGVVPRVVWTRTVTPDDKNRIELTHNCLLLTSESPDPRLGRPRRILIEAGTGDKLDEKMTKVFGLDPSRAAHHLVAGAGLDPGEIDQVIVSHLHFDHAGGLTRRCEPGETPDWSADADGAPGDASGDSPDVRLAFPRAEVVVQEREWRDALANDAVMTKTYYRDHLLPLGLPLPDGSPRVRTLAAPAPFAQGEHPPRSALPETTADQRTVEAAPGVGAFLVPGHTWGQQAVTFTDTEDRRIVFTPDVLPTAWHTGAAYSLAYDVEPYSSMLSKRWLLTEAERHGWHLLLDHEPADPLRRVAKNAKAWYTLEPAGGA